MPEPIKKNYLCDIEGLCAVYNKPTLNERSYSEIYKRLLSGQDYRFNEMLKRGGIFCELGHPVQESADFERTETDLNKACAILTDIYEGEDNKVYAKGKVLDTPAGRIYMAMKPFYQFGFSSRGSYDAVDSYLAEGPDGWNQDSYVFKGFDIVALPATEDSVISATEGLATKKTRKSARESLDINEIANAANITPDEINRELDRLFNEKGDIPGQELVSMREYVDMSDGDNTAADSKNLDNKSDIDLEAGSVNTDDLENKVSVDSPISDIKQDLQTALTDAAKLREDLDKKTFETQNLNSEIEALRLENESLLKRAIDAEKTLKDYEEIKMLSKKLVDSYDGVLAEFDAEKSRLEEKADDFESSLAEEQQTSTKWKQEADKAANERKRIEDLLKKANESVEMYKRKALNAISEMKQAKESLIKTYSKNYGVSVESITKKLGSTYKVSQIQPAVESLAKEGIRMSDYNGGVYPSGTIVKSTKEKIEYQDDIDRELFEALLDN